MERRFKYGYARRLALRFVCVCREKNLFIFINFVVSIFLGTQKQLPTNMLKDIAKTLEEYNIHGLLLIGGFEVSKARALLNGKFALRRFTR